MENKSRGVKIRLFSFGYEKSETGKLPPAPDNFSKNPSGWFY